MIVFFFPHNIKMKNIASHFQHSQWWVLTFSLPSSAAQWFCLHRGWIPAHTLPLDGSNYCKINGKFASKVCLVPMQCLAASAQNRCQFTQCTLFLPQGLNSQTGVGAWRRTWEPGWGPNKGSTREARHTLLDAQTAIEIPVSGYFMFLSGNCGKD